VPANSEKVSTGYALIDTSAAPNVKRVSATLFSNAASTGAPLRTSST